MDARGGPERLDQAAPRTSLDGRRGTRLLRPSEVMRELGVSRSWLYAAAKDGRIPSLRLGGPDGPLRFVPEDLERWLDDARAAWRPTDTAAGTLRRRRDVA